MKMFGKIDPTGGDFRNTKNPIWLSPQDSRSVKTFDNLSPMKPVIVNVQQTGFYRLGHLDKSLQIFFFSNPAPKSVTYYLNGHFLSLVVKANDCVV